MEIDKIPFNKPYLTGKEIQYMHQSVETGHISGNGDFTKKCQQFFSGKYGFKKCLLTTSCTDALEMAALLINVQSGDEVIVPSYTFVSSALPFVRQGAVIKFVDSRADRPGLDENEIEKLITPKTKAIVVVHYAGVACEMDKIMELAIVHNLYVIEDAAQSIDSYYKEKPLGSIGHFGCFSFHETKNLQCGEGGMLVINDETFYERAEILWEKGTNRAKFFRGEIDKYGWVDIGSSFLPSDLLAAFLLAQLEQLKRIQQKRISIWNQYYSHLSSQTPNEIKLPVTPNHATNNGHMFYIICSSALQREEMIKYLKAKNILSVFHYQSLHKSGFMKGRFLPECLNADYYSDCLLRLPLYFELSREQVEKICKSITNFFD